jgi:4-hydroxybutyrate CoA-transferase
LYDWVDDNPMIEMHPTEYVNDPFVIAQNDRMVAINSAIEVDLTGQVCADSIGPKLYSGVGGQLDFMYGASRSKNGVPIIALPSTATMKDGTVISRIAGMLKHGAGVVTSRNHVRYVVTEHGVADLYGKTIRQRAQALINVAHPQFREELGRQARELHYI